MTRAIWPDLHVHTAASDGAYAPGQVVAMAAQAGVNLLAITDHDTVDGIAEARDAASKYGIQLLPGVEISTEGEREVHILGYGLDETDPILRDFFLEKRAERIERARRMGERLAELGMPLPVEEIIAGAGISVGRPHIARAMVKAGYVPTAHDAFELYLGRGKPAYVPRQYLSAGEAVAFLRERGAVPVLAHPALMNLADEELASWLETLQGQGLAGMEVYHPANREHYAAYDAMARQHGLLVTGGSDFHAEDTAGHAFLGEIASEWPLAGADAQALLQCCAKM